MLYTRRRCGRQEVICGRNDVRVRPGYPPPSPLQSSPQTISARGLIHILKRRTHSFYIAQFYNESQSEIILTPPSDQADVPLLPSLLQISHSKSTILVPFRHLALSTIVQGTSQIRKCPISLGLLHSIAMCNATVQSPLNSLW